ncbi:MAG: hypothetical protein AAF065_13915 [Verrucomicrobiota bacterium]
MNKLIKTKRGQVIAFIILTVALAGVVVWDFLNHQSSPEEPLEPRWNTVEPSKASAVEWVESQAERKESDPVVKKVYEGYQKLRDRPSFIEEGSEVAYPPIREIADEDAKASTTALIKFEHIVASDEVEHAVEIPQLNLPVGTMVYARLLKPVDSRFSNKEQPVYGELVKPLVINARTILPSRARLIGQIKSMRGGQASFDQDWRVIIDGKDRYALNGHLQERDYDPIKRIYGALDGVTGLRMEPLEITYEPKVHKIERFLEDIVRPIAVRKSQVEILRELELPTVDDPWDLDGFEDDESNSGEIYFLPSGAEFYIQIL